MMTPHNQKKDITETILLLKYAKSKNHVYFVYILELLLRAIGDLI